MASPIRRVRRPIPEITREEAEAKEAEYTRIKNHQPIVPPTNKNYLRVKELWKDFLQFVHDDRPFPQQYEDMPTAGRLKHFIEWVFETSIGMLYERVTFDTLKTTWFCWRSMYFRETDNVLRPEVTTDVLCFIKTELRERGLAMVRRRKAFANALDVGWMLTYLWCYDKHEFRHPRTKAQQSFVCLLVVYTGARLGTIVESSAYRGSNEALCYKDFELIRLPTGPNNTLEFALKVRFRFMKGKRDQGKGDIVEYTWVVFHEDRVRRGRCIITHFLGFAFADDVFADLEEPRQLEYLRSTGVDECITLKFKESKKDMLVLRHCNSDGTISPDRAMTYNTIATESAELGIRLGFYERVKFQALRRGTANEINGTTEVSENQYVQLLGHSVKVMGENYISNISAIDVQGIINHETLRQDHIRILRSMRLHLNPNAPTQLPFRECMRLLDNPELVKLDTLLDRLQVQRRVEGDTIELRKQHTKETWNRKRLFRRLYQKARFEFRDKWFEVVESNKIRKMIEDGEKGISIHEVDEKPLEVPLDFVSSAHFPDHFLIANGFWTQPPYKSSLPATSLIQSLQRICKPEEYILYYPGEAPVDGCCLICEKSMAEISSSRRPDHIHDCFRNMHRRNIETDFSNSRPKCCKWGKCKSGFFKKPVHLLKDFGNGRSDSERRLLRAKESKRLSDSRRKQIRRQQKPDINFDQVQSRKSISGHLKRHTKHQTLCLWDNCNVQCVSEQDLERHLWKSHGVTIKQAAFTPQFCFEHPDIGWFINEFDWEDHCETHAKIPRRSLNLVRSYHMITAGLQCPFCQQFTQFTHRGSFNRHIEAHEKDYRNSGPLKCPVSSCMCKEDIFINFFELKIHLFDIHDLKLRGFTRSHGLRQEKGTKSVSKSDLIVDEEIEDEDIVDWENEDEDIVDWENEDDEDNEDEWMDSDKNDEDNSEDLATEEGRRY